MRINKSKSSDFRKKVRAGLVLFLVAIAPYDARSFLTIIASSLEAIEDGGNITRFGCDYTYPQYNSIVVISNSGLKRLESPLTPLFV